MDTPLPFWTWLAVCCGVGFLVGFIMTAAMRGRS